MGKAIPSELGQFITQHLENVGHLEVLLLLYHSTHRSWKAAEINRELRGNRHSIVRWLELLVARGLVISEGDCYRFQPASDGLRDQVDELAKTYQARPSAVIGLIHSCSSPQVSN